MTTSIPRCNRRARPRVEQLESRDCPASVLDPNLAVRDVITGLSQPTGFAFLGANDVLITEKASGLVKRFTNGAANGVPLDLAATHRVTVNNFLADGGDNYPVFREATNRFVGEIDLDAFARYIEFLGTVNPGPQNRINLIP